MFYVILSLPIAIGILESLGDLFESVFKSHISSTFYKEAWVEKSASSEIIEKKEIDLLKKFIKTSEVRENVSKGDNQALPPAESFFSKPRKINWELLNEKRKNIGETGEQLVLDIERNYLLRHGREDLASKIRHVASLGDGYGYDIQSFFLDGREKYIEVKSTSSSSDVTPFYISQNELKFLEVNKETAFVYRLFNIVKGKELSLQVHSASEV